MKCAVVDIGSNTMRMNIYSIKGGEVDLLFKKKQFSSLASYNENGLLSQEGINILLKTLSTFKKDLSKIKIKNMYIFATASIRNVANCSDIIKLVKNELDLDIDLISGKKEAFLGYMGLEDNLKKNEGINIDVGGGSAEVIIYKDNDVVFSESMPEGSLSLYSKYVSGVLPNIYEVSHMQDAIKQNLESIELKNIKKIPKHVTAIGGTARALVKLTNSLKVGKKDYEIEKSDLEEMINLISKGDIFLKKKIVRLLPERIHTITTGMIIYNMICEKLNVDKILVSKNGIREGYLDYKLNGVNDEKQ